LSLLLSGVLTKESSPNAKTIEAKIPNFSLRSFVAFKQVKIKKRKSARFNKAQNKYNMIF